jgi:diaminopimelate decarboxylase
MGYSYQQKTLHCDKVSLADIAAQTGTPCYVYSAESILERYHAYDRAFGDHPHQVCYAVKANSNLSLLRLLADAGAGFDIVSGGELYRVLKAGGDPAKTVFAGVGKTAEEIEYALSNKIHTFNCESEAELELIDTLAAKHDVRARVGVRVNPDVDASTHPYISTGLREHKFGVDISEVETVYARAKHFQNLDLESVSCHIGSQLLDTDPMMETVDKMLALVGRLRGNGIPIKNLDLGGGLGVAYKPEDKAPGIACVVASIRRKVEGRDLKIMVEPGRSIVGESGVLLTRVLFRKQTPRKEFIVVDAAMNDLLRPALYQSHHEIIPVEEPAESPNILADVVGPVCETGDFLARNREIPPVLPGALMAVSTAGAYGFVLSSNYNSRPRVPEVLVEGDTWRIVRQRESLEDLIKGE